MDPLWLLSRRSFLAGSAALLMAGACGGETTESAGPSAPTEPDSYLTWRWGQDPFSLGAYSFSPVGTGRQDRITLAEPVDGRLFFAGEATAPDAPATVHGAYLSGQRAAAEVLEAGPHGEIVVVGAGMAGLACARQLTEAGHDVVVVEARNRLGGRIYTNTWMDGIPLDLGASWIHGTDGNPLSGLVADHDVETVVTHYESISLYGPDGIRIDPVLTGEAAIAGVAILESVTGQGSGDIPIGPVVAGLVDGLDPDPTERVAIEWIINSEIELSVGADRSDVSLNDWVDSDDPASGDEVVFPDGYHQLVEPLADGLDVRLGLPVSGVEHDPSGVRVKTSEGTLEGTAAVLTLPLGVLRSGKVSVVPSLPAAKLAAIDALEMGLLNKLFLKFPEVFWDSSEVIGITTPEGELWPTWLNLDHSLGVPILLAFSGGSKGWAIEAMSDDEMVASAVSALESVY